jgi:dTDP-4-dehydrorhamnose reductase
VRILIIGASGLVGSHVLAEAKARGHGTLGTYRTFPVDGLALLDLEDVSATRALLESFRPDWVVHSAGWTWVDGCETDPGRAFRENCDQPAMVARLCRDRGCRFAYVSTTYVFDGTAGPYTEEDTPNPINVYAKSKWAAEQRIQEILAGNALIPRVICVWGREARGKNFVYQAIKALGEGRSMTLPSDQIGNPTWAGDIAAWLLSLMEKGKFGIWNLAGHELNCSRERWFCLIRDAGLKSGTLPGSIGPGYKSVPTSELKQPALRPLHAGAVIGKILSFEKRDAHSPANLDPILRGVP